MREGTLSRFFLLKSASRGQVRLHSENGLDSSFLAFPVELNSSKEISVVRKGQRFHVVVLSGLHQFRYRDGSVQETEMAMNVEVDKRMGIHGRNLPSFEPTTGRKLL